MPCFLRGKNGIFFKNVEISIMYGVDKKIEGKKDTFSFYCCAILISETKMIQRSNRFKILNTDAHQSKKKYFLFLSLDEKNLKQF